MYIYIILSGKIRQLYLMEKLNNYIEDNKKKYIFFYWKIKLLNKNMRFYVVKEMYSSM